MCTAIRYTLYNSGRIKYSTSAMKVKPRMTDKKRRPPPRDNRVTIALDDKTYRESVAKAGSPSRLRSILRIFLGLWSVDEYPPPDMPFYTEADIEEDQTRAKKRPRK